MDSAGLDQPMSQLDGALLKINNRVFASAEGPIMFNGTTVKYPQIYFFFQRELDGAWIKNYIPLGTRTLSSGANTANATVVTLNDGSDGANISATLQEIDFDSTAASVAVKDKQYFLLWVRSPQATGTGFIHGVGLNPIQQLAGSDNLGTGTTKTVTFPTGITLQDTNYKVFLQQAGATTTLNWYTTLGPRVTTKNAGSFVITVSVAAASETFDWLVVP